MSDIEIITFGCRLNAYESEVMRAKATAAGAGDAIILNTCAVTTEATRQARQAYVEEVIRVVQRVLQRGTREPLPGYGRPRV